MRVAMLAPLVESVPPEAYGGTELVVSLLTEELVARGHEVTLFATGDSITTARLFPCAERGLRMCTEIPVSRWMAYDLAALIELEKRLSEFDIVHNHMGYQALPFLKKIEIPSVTTNHNPVKPYNKPIYTACRDASYVSISDAYRRWNLPDVLNYVATVYNGIDIAMYPAGENERTYLLFLGRVCHDKGTAEAIEIARALKLPLKIAGKVDRNDQQYFEEKVKPWLSEPGIEYVGEVDHEQKLSLYSSAIAVVYPIHFHEPFGLVMAEAMATGTPLAALDMGAVKEVLKDRETAVIGQSVEELIDRFAEIKDISPAACRDRAVRLFSRERMTEDYLGVYERFAASPAQKEMSSPLP